MKHSRRILSLAMALLLVFALAPAEGLIPVAHAVTQEQIDNLKNASKELEKTAYWASSCFRFSSSS